MSRFRSILKSFEKNALFICMIVGIVFHSFISWAFFLTPYLLFLMLLITYCRVSIRYIRPEPLHLWLSGVQLVGCLLIYFILKPFGSDLAEGSMLCMLAPAATSSPVIVGLLGGSIVSMATYSIFSNLLIAFVAPCIFSAFGAHNLTAGGGDVSFIQAFLTICSKVMPLLLGPFVLSFILKKVTPKIHNQLREKQIYSFWLWAMALTIVMANTTSKVIGIVEENNTLLLHVVWIALGAAFVCVLQFLTGWLLGKKYGNKIVGGQGLGQKNTILAIWMANTFFNPLVAIAPASYVVWQNLINSYQLWKYRRGNT